MGFFNNKSYVGMFTLEGNSIDIADPYLSGISILLDKIPIGNEKFVTIRNCVGGTYNIYHLHDSYNQLKFLVAIHDSCDLNILEDYENEFVGYISSSLSGEVALVDEQYRFDAQYCYYEIEESAYYDAETVLDYIDDMEYSDEIKNLMREMIQSKLKKNEQPMGKDFIELLGDLPIWPGFRKLGCKSTHWYEELSRTLTVAYKPASPIKGGVVSVAEKGYLPCSIYRNKRGMVIGMCIGLEDSKAYGSYCK